jgi:GH24 family phage-related lysozyme (muramidase)
MQTSDRGARFIACREAVVTVAYEDGKHPDGSPKYSIGIGSQDPPPMPGDVITIAEAFDRLRTNLRSRDAMIGKAIDVDIAQCQWDAVASLYYQAGTKPLRAVAGLFNKGKPIMAMMEFARFNCGADGVPTDGHSKRRVREMILGIDSYYGDLSHVLVFEGDPRKVAPKMMPFPEGI